MSGAAEAQDYSDPEEDFNAEDTTDRDNVVSRVEDILVWLRTPTDNDKSPPESVVFQQLPTQAHLIKRPLGSEVIMRG